MLRIAFYTPSVACINVGGVETFVREIALRMIEKGHEVSILSGLGLLSRESQELSRSGAQFKLFPFIRRYTRLSNAIISISRSTGSKLTPYAVESFSMLPFGLSYLSTHKHDVVAIIGMSDSLARIVIKRRTILHYQGGLIVDWQIQFLHKFPPECIIACSQFTAKQLMINQITCPIYSIPNGVDTKRFCPDSTIRQRMRDELKVSDKDVILFVGRFTEEKGVEYLIRSMSLVRHKNSAVLLLIGSGPLQSKYMALAAEHDIEMKILGPIPNILLPPYYNAADIFVLPSLLEPAAMVLAEAQACGVPVIATNTGGTPERVVDNTTGLLVPTIAPEELAYAINLLLNDTEMRLRMGKEARKYTLENFDWEKIVTKILHIYLQVSQKII